VIIHAAGSGSLSLHALPCTRHVPSFALRNHPKHEVSP
jgi:hypothetical protein